MPKSVESNKTLGAFLILMVIASFFLVFYLSLNTSSYLRFSDAAKFADVAKNLIEGRDYGANFSFFSKNVFMHSYEGLFSARGMPLLMPYSIAAMFGLFGTSDFSVILTSSVFYFALVVATYVLARHLYGNLVGFLSGLSVAANINFLDYATSGASETLFSFIAILAAYFALSKKKWANILFFASLVLLYLTRPQGFLFIGVLLFMWLVINFSFKKATFLVFGFLIAAFLFDKHVLYPLSWKTNVYPIFTRGLQAFFQYSSNFAVSDALRGGVARNVNLLGLGRKAFWNLYNFYRLLPQIASPYMWGLFVIGLFKWSKDRLENSLKVATIFMVIVTFLVTALTIPFFRYIHPVVPLVYIFATATLVWIVRSMVNGQWLMVKKWPLVKKLLKEKFIILTSSFLILFFVVGQTLGVIFLDSRFKAARTNRGKPPVYVQLSWILRDNTSPDDVIVTNLDTWGTWYGERKTVWFPLKPEQLDFEEFEQTPFDAIYLTSYLMDDENYHMGDEWREIFYNPKTHKNSFIPKHFRLKSIYEIGSESNYEKNDARAILLVRKDQGGAQ